MQTLVQITNKFIRNFEKSVPINDSKYIEAREKLKKDNLNSNVNNELLSIKEEYTNKYWGTNRGMVTYNKNNKIHIDTHGHLVRHGLKYDFKISNLNF